MEETGDFLPLVIRDLVMKKVNVDHPTEEAVFKLVGFLSGTRIYIYIYMDVSQHRGKTPKMDGENDGSKPYEQMDDLWVSIFWETPIYIYIYQL